MLNSTPDTAEQFWQDAEKTLGCKVLSFGLAQYMGGDTYRKHKNIWGLIYISEIGVHFYHFPQQSWFIFGSNKNQKDFSLELLFENILSWKRPQKVSVIKKVLGKDDIPLTITARASQSSVADNTTDVIENAQEYMFKLDMRQEDILRSIQRYIENKEITEDV